MLEKSRYALERNEEELKKAIELQKASMAVYNSVIDLMGEYEKKHEEAKDQQESQFYFMCMNIIDDMSNSYFNQKGY